MGYPSPARTGWGAPRPGKDEPPPPRDKLRLDRLCRFAVRLLRFPIERLCCSVVLFVCFADQVGEIRSVSFVNKSVSLKSGTRASSGAKFTAIVRPRMAMVKDDGNFFNVYQAVFQLRKYSQKVIFQ